MVRLMSALEIAIWVAEDTSQSHYNSRGISWALLAFCYIKYYLKRAIGWESRLLFLLPWYLLM